LALFTIVTQEKFSSAAEQSWVLLMHAANTNMQCILWNVCS